MYILSTGSQSGPKLEEILEQLQDPLIPVRSHALVDLRRLVVGKVCELAFIFQLTDLLLS